MWMPLPPQQPAVTLSFDLQNLMGSSVGTSELLVYQNCSRRLRYRGNSICRVNKLVGRLVEHTHLYKNLTNVASVVAEI